MFISTGTAISASKSSPAANGSKAATESAILEKVDINSANEMQLETLPGVGPKMAVRITEYRKTNGEFKSVDDLQKVKGIGPKLLQKIKPLIKIS
jgi:competence protein ComEA